MAPETVRLTTIRRPSLGLGWGPVIGAGSGVIAAWVFVMVLFGSIVAVEGLADTAGDDGVVVFLLIYGLIGSLVGGVIGSVAGAVAGFVFGVTRSEGLAQFVAPVIGVIPFAIGPRMLSDGEGWSTLFVSAMLFVAAAYGLIGWIAGRVFARKLAEADVAHQLCMASGRDRDEIDRLVGTN